MRKIVTGVMIVWGCLGGMGCSRMASEFDHLVKQYKQELCAAYRAKSRDDKNKSLERQASLKKEYEAALASLSEMEKAKLTLKWTVAQSEASQGNCE